MRESLQRRALILPACLLLLATLVVVCITAARLHIRTVLERVSSNPETLHAEWVAWACGDDTPRITEVIGSGVKSRLADRPLLLLVPPNGENPESSRAAFSGNRFVLTGYRYRSFEMNLFTGHREELSSQALYVTKWSVELPYHEPGPNGETVEVRFPLTWEADGVGEPAASLPGPECTTC